MKWLWIVLLTASLAAQPTIDPVGRWKIFHSDGTPIWVEVRPDGTCTSDWAKGERGRWTLDQGKLLLDWSDGWRDLITVDGQRLRKKGYAPGAPLEGQPSNQTAAYKVKK